MRHNLLMKFYCATCGSPLYLSYPKEGFETPEEPYSKRFTGAAVCNIVQLVEPCSGCVSKLTAPAKKLSEAIKALAADVGE